MDEFEDIVYLNDDASEMDILEMIPESYEAHNILNIKKTIDESDAWSTEIIQKEQELLSRDKHMKRTIEHSCKFANLIQELDPLFKSLDILNPPMVYNANHNNRPSEKARTT